MSGAMPPSPASSTEMLRQQSRAPQALASLTEADARAILAQEVPHRRKKQRLSHALGVGSLIGFTVACLLAGTRVIPIQVMMIWQAVNAGTSIIRGFGATASKRQQKALLALVPYAQPEDVTLLIEGLEYANRGPLVERLVALLPHVAMETVPEGARRLLRTQVKEPHAPLEFRQCALEALMRHPDPQTLRLVEKLAKTRAQVPGEEGRIRLTPFVAPPLPSPAQARTLLDQQAAQLGMLGKWGLFVGFVAAVGLMVALSEPFFLLAWMISVGVAAIGTLIFLFRGTIPSYTRQAAYLSLLENNALEDLPRLKRHFCCLKSLTHQKQALAALEQWEGSPS